MARRNQPRATALPKPTRDLTVDLLRGYFLFMIVVDHMGSFPSLFEPFTGGGRLLISAAEGFFFLSGLLVGRLRGWDVRMGNYEKAKKWLLHRAGVLYIVSVTLTLTYTFIAWALNYSPRVTLGVSKVGWLETIWRTVTLQYSFGLADMLPLYTVYLLASIAVFKLLGKNRWKTVLAISIGLWIIPLATAGYMRPIGSYFSALSWQLLFFAGLVLGYYNQEVWDWWLGFKRATRIKILAALATAALVGMAYSWALRLIDGLYSSSKDFIKPAFGNIELGPGRVLFFAICIIVAYHGVRHFESRINRTVGWFFVPLGQNSLFVYALHSALIFPFIGFPVKSLLPATALNAAMLTTVFLITKRYQRLPSKRKYL